MLKNVRLRQFPNSAECLRWSQDGSLAVLAGEDVIILVPKQTKDNAQVRKNTQFWRPRIRMRNLIIAQIDDEIIPADREIYSVGEEQGPGYVKDLAWSPLGYSRYRKCIVSVVSTNHEVNVFVPIGHPSKDWTHRHDLNELMRAYTGFPETDSQISPDHRQRLRARGKNIAWSPGCMTPWHRWGDSVLAVANDCLELLLFRVDHEKAEIIGHIQPFSEDEVQERLGYATTFLKNVCWSPWHMMEEGRKWVSYLTYTDRGKVYMQKVVLEEDEEGGKGKVTVEGRPVVIAQTESEYHEVHSALWASEVFNNRAVFACAMMLRVTIIEVDLKTGDVMLTQDHKNDFIELTAGLCFTSAAPSTLLLQLLTVSGRAQTILHPITLPTPATSLLHNTNLSSPSSSSSSAPTDWLTAMRETREDFTGEKDISAARLRSYGLAVSPLGGITAVAISTHPVDQLEYITGANERLHILFGTHEGTQNSWQTTRFDAKTNSVPSPHLMATEALFLELTGLGGPYAGVVREATETILKRLGEEGGVREGIDDEDVEGSLDRALLGNTLCNAARYRHCLRLHPRPEEGPSECPEIIAAAVTAVLSAPFDPAPESLRLLYSLACIGILALAQRGHILSLAERAFDYLDAHTPENVRFTLERAVIAMHQGVGEKLEVERGIVSEMERCELCGDGMVWRDLKIAECERGHRFSRCAATWLPVVEPGGTKECGVCERTVLGREKVGGEGLAGYVSRAWEVCLMCGGRFWSEDS